MRRALVLASVASMIDLFNIPNIKLLIDLKYQVDVAANFIEGNTCSDDRIVALKQKLREMGVGCYQIDFTRNVLNIGKNFRAYKQIKKLIKNNKYDLIHCHTPIGGFLSRLAAKDIRKKGTRVIYTAHGFHFFKGAPKLNWFLFYPLEKIASKWTDILITITQEDYALACKKMYAKKVIYLPGVGIDVKKFLLNVDSVGLRKKLRDEIGLSDKNVVLMSAGELNKNKNHALIIRALSKLNNRNVHYIIAGRGPLKDYLLKLSEHLGVKEQVHLLGFRSDVNDLLKATDIFVHPSFREGLSVALMEAMANSLPVICSNIRGNIDLVDDGKGGIIFDASDVDSAYLALKNILICSNLKEYGVYNLKKVEQLDISEILKTMTVLYS